MNFTRYALIFLATFTALASGARSPDSNHYMQWAVKLTGYPYPATLPRVIFADDKTITAAYCQNGPVTEDCRVGGFYRSGDTVWVNSSQRPYAIRGTLVHELVHYLQVTNGKFRSRCEAEREANYVEWLYLRTVEGQTSSFRFDREWYNCL